MHRTGKRHKTGTDGNDIHIQPSEDKWLVLWVYKNSTFIHTRTFDTEGMAYQFKHTLIRENKGSMHNNQDQVSQLDCLVGRSVIHKEQDDGEHHSRFVKAKREDFDNGYGPTERADFDALRYERTRSPAGDAVRKALRMGIADCPNIGCDANSDGRCCAFAVCAAMRPNNSMTGGMRET